MKKIIVFLFFTLSFSAYAETEKYFCNISPFELFPKELSNKKFDNVSLSMEINYSLKELTILETGSPWEFKYNIEISNENIVIARDMSDMGKSIKEVIFKKEELFLFRTVSTNGFGHGMNFGNCYK